MKRWRFNGASFIVALLIFVVSIWQASAAPIDELIASAKKEGVIELLCTFYLDSSRSPEIGRSIQ